MLDRFDLHQISSFQKLSALNHLLARTAGPEPRAWKMTPESSSWVQSVNRAVSRRAAFPVLIPVLTPNATPPVSALPAAIIAQHPPDRLILSTTDQSSPLISQLQERRIIRGRTPRQMTFRSQVRLLACISNDVARQL
jgi:hypothetical protein